MNRTNRFLLAVLIFSAIGLLMSGYLSYRNYFSSGCSQGPLSSIVTCGGPKAVKIFGQPTCIYGFVVFFITFITAVVGLQSKTGHRVIRTLIVLGIAGTLFSAYLAVYEVFFLKFGFSPMPACIYGLIFFLGILLSSIGAFKSAVSELNEQASELAQ